MRLFSLTLDPDEVRDGFVAWNLSPCYRLILSEGVEPSPDEDVFFMAQLLETEPGLIGWSEIGGGTGDTAAASVLDLLLDLDANDAKLPKEVADKLTLIAVEATRLVLHYMTELPAYEGTLDARKEAVV